LKTTFSRFEELLLEVSRHIPFSWIPPWNTVGASAGRFDLSEISELFNATLDATSLDQPTVNITYPIDAAPSSIDAAPFLRFFHHARLVVGNSCKARGEFQVWTDRVVLIYYYRDKRTLFLARFASPQGSVLFAVWSRWEIGDVSFSTPTMFPGYDLQSDLYRRRTAEESGALARLSPSNFDGY
jgi:hypothetical protein